MTPNLTAFTGVDSQNLPDVMVSVQFILAIGGKKIFAKIPILIEINWGILLSGYIKSIKARRSKDQCKNG
ncbi:hypothetical protein [Lactobacillus delbrueckii]|uniref:hypothetical protein n=1 Tax=Lactobacillus delbrueckii TaxID=1584 RepID=UPI001E3FED36|nr:hypothetical protein [Lactobacillus delbrueckii]MCD5534262.1 hypothetical protein [Lactobacillus delbrueckii subsp. lactis]